MENQIKQELYASPEVEVIETQMQTLICQSENLEEITRDNEAW